MVVFRLIGEPISRLADYSPQRCAAPREMRACRRPDTRPLTPEALYGSLRPRPGAFYLGALVASDFGGVDKVCACGGCEKLPRKITEILTTYTRSMK